MKSYWTLTAEKIASFPPLTGERQADVVVIGGGMAGVLTAYYLKQHGADVLLLEADTIGSGQTENTTAKVTSQHGLIYEKLQKAMGLSLARQYAAANEGAIQSYRELIRREHIDCQWEDCPAFLYSLEDADDLKKEAEAAKALGLPASFTTDTELPFLVKGAVRFADQGRFHPLSFLRAVAKGLPICEHSRVQRVEGTTCFTERGKVFSKEVVFACHYPFINFPGAYFMRMHQERSYVLALSGTASLKGVYLGVDKENAFSFRQAGKVLLLGGENHRTGENRPGGRYQGLLEKAQTWWPGCREVARWSAQDCMPMDGVPYIGPYAADAPHWWVATGFQKWGMTTSMVAATLLTNAILGEGSPYAPVFAPSRFTPAASAKNFLVDGYHAAKDLVRQVLQPPRAALDELPPGHGGIVDVEGEKVGVYKTEEGKVFTVSTRCPHLGCQLEWNPDEKSWDCPCHGSRFDHTGKRLDGPAEEGLL